MKPLLFLITFFSLPFILHSCKPITAYPIKKGAIEFDWNNSTALTAKVIVLDRYPLEPPVYGQTRVFTRASDTVKVSIQEFEYRGTCTIEPYENPENFHYASVRYSYTVSNSSTKEAQLWDVNQNTP
ncbi:hypothetical protein [Flammeovirga sp. SJP92]|uniref:hypothetical protein n=1 Tax=Flammeovirga sp. SJP92 TaxID=1775430 RepID=UPI0007876F3F|nr:hypothetical protein [Flammeovirga sp. SJP92]KXX69895.1 hypothetical protein AVL50_13515 [Flammeovirga sp. SJP92]